MIHIYIIFPCMEIYDPDMILKYIIQYGEKNVQLALNDSLECYFTFLQLLLPRSNSLVASIQNCPSHPPG